MIITQNICLTIRKMLLTIDINLIYYYQIFWLKKFTGKEMLYYKLLDILWIIIFYKGIWKIANQKKKKKKMKANKMKINNYNKNKQKIKLFKKNKKNLKKILKKFVKMSKSKMKEKIKVYKLKNGTKKRNEYYFILLYNI